MNLHVNFNAEKRSGTTGRQVKITDDYFNVTQFVIDLCSTSEYEKLDNLLKNNDIAKSVYADINRAIQHDLCGYYYRGRRFAQNETPESAIEFYPPTITKQGKGRYNKLGNNVLYLCKSKETIQKEVPPNNKKPLLFIQQFNIKISNVNVLKLDKDLENTCPNLQRFLLESERLVDGTSLVKYPYTATHFIAEICHKLNIAAVEYPSVQGGYITNKEAVNLVVFEPYWREVFQMANGKPFKYDCCIN